MRQSGILAAAGIYALSNNIHLMSQDHENAFFLSHEMNQISQLNVINNPPDTNIVIFKLMNTNLLSSEFHRRCIAAGVRFSEISTGVFRAVTHLGITRDHTINVCRMLRTLFIDQ